MENGFSTKYISPKVVYNQVDPTGMLNVKLVNVTNRPFNLVFTRFRIWLPLHFDKSYFFNRFFKTFQSENSIFRS